MALAASRTGALRRSQTPIPLLVPAMRRAAERRQALSSHRLSAALVLAILACGAPVGGCDAHAEPALSEAVSAADQFAAFIAEASRRFGVPESWIHAVMRIESAADARALSPKGAMGLMQIMPGTWASLRARYGLGDDPFDPHDNILGGAAYLRELHDRYGSPGFLAAYNAGPGRYKDHLATGRPLPLETRAYVANLAPTIGIGEVDSAGIVKVATRSWTQAPLFIARTGSESTDVRPPFDRQSIALSPAAHSEDQTAFPPSSTGLFVPSFAGSRRP